MRFRTKPRRLPPPQPREPFLAKWLAGLGVAAVMLLSLRSCVQRQLGLAPFGGHIDGVIVSKQTVIHESQYGSQLETTVEVRTSRGNWTTVVPGSIYRLAQPGWTFHQRENTFMLESPDGRTAKKVTMP